MSIEPIYHLAEAAERCGVAAETVHEWLEKGLRHVPLGHSTAYRPRDVLIRESWLAAFLDAQSVVKPRRTTERAPTPKPEADRPKGKGGGQRKAARRGGGNILGPCPV